MVTEIKWLIPLLMNATNWPKKNNRVGMIGWERLPTGNCARN